MKWEDCKTKRDALLVLKGKTDMLDELTDMKVVGIPFKEAAKFALKKLKEDMALVEKSY